MFEKLIKATPIILVLFAIVGCNNPFADQAIRYPTNLGGYSDIHYYSFEPKMIFSALAQGQEKIFKPSQTHLENNSFPSGSFLWQQQDYLKIAGALNQVVAKDTLDDWNIYLMSFDRDCADNPTGFDYARIVYFKADKNQYTAREIDIYPLAREADWGGNTYFPHPFLFGWESINLEQLNITAEGALQIAELNGGRTARLAAKNECYILVVLSPNTDHERWGVYYYGAGAATLFELRIDPYSGEYEIPTPVK